MVRQLGVFLDWNLNFKHHIMTKCTSAMASLAKIKGIRNYLTKEAAETLVLSMAISHLDYCNGILMLVPDVDIKHMQLVQNIAAKLVLGKSKSDSSSQCHHELHWLPIKQRIQYKILLFGTQVFGLQSTKIFCRSCWYIIPMKKGGEDCNVNFNKQEGW